MWLFFSIIAHGGNEATCRTILTISIKKNKYVDWKHELEVFCYRTIIACPVKPISYIYMRKFDLQCLELKSEILPFCMYKIDHLYYHAASSQIQYICIHGSSKEFCCFHC